MGYFVFRERRDGIVCQSLAHGGNTCLFYSDPSMNALQPTAHTVSTTLRDRPGPGRWIYRVAAIVGLTAGSKRGNFMALSTPAAAHVRR